MPMMNQFSNKCHVCRRDKGKNFKRIVRFNICEECGTDKLKMAKFLQHYFPYDGNEQLRMKEKMERVWVRKVQ